MRIKEIAMSPEEQNSLDYALMDALFAGDVPLEEVRELLEQGANVNAQYQQSEMMGSQMRCGALHLAARNKRVDLTELLVSHGANLERPDEDGYTALHTAASRGDIANMTALIEAGADIHSRNSFGNTLAHTAASSRDMRPFEFVLNLGLEAYAKNNGGKTSMDYARSNGVYKQAEQTLQSLRPWPAIRVEREKNGTPKKEQPAIRKSQLFSMNSDGRAMLDNPTTWHKMWDRLDEPVTWSDLQTKDAKGRPWLARAVECRQLDKLVELREKDGETVPLSAWIDRQRNPSEALLALGRKQGLTELFHGKAGEHFNSNELRLIYNALPKEHKVQVSDINQVLMRRNEAERASQPQRGR